MLLHGTTHLSKLAVIYCCNLCYGIKIRVNVRFVQMSFTQCLLCTNNILFPFCLWEVISFQSRPKKITSESKRFYLQSSPQLPFSILVFTIESVEQFSVLSAIVMLMITLYHFSSQKYLPCICVYNLLFCCFKFSGNQFHSCTNICIPKVSDPCNLPLYQAVLSFCLVAFYFT